MYLSLPLGQQVYNPLLEEGEEWVGWVKGESTIGNAMFQSIEFFEGLSGKMPPVSVWLTPFQGGSYIVGEGGEGDACNVMLASGAQGLRDQDPALLQQAIAFSFASCYIIENFGDQDISSWWADGLGWYLSDVVFPDASLEIELLHVPSTLAGEELGTTILERTITNMAFFEWMDAASDVEGVLSTAATINTSGLDAVANVADLLHDFEKALSDGVIVDQGGAHEFTPGADSYILAKGDKVEAKPQPFGVVRVEVLVPSGMFACVKYDSKGEVKASYRTGSAGSGGGWGAPPRVASGRRRVRRNGARVRRVLLNHRRRRPREAGLHGRGGGEGEPRASASRYGLRPVWRNEVPLRPRLQLSGDAARSRLRLGGHPG